jgi:hypothetical protein
MSWIDDLKAELRERWSESATLELCLRIVDVMSRLSDDELQMWTFATFKKAVERAAIDEELIRAIGLLTNSSVHALDSRLLFIDDDEREFEIEKEELAAARKTGFFIHPETGRPVHHFESKIIPFFVPSEKFKRLRAHQ